MVGQLGAGGGAGRGQLLVGSRQAASLVAEVGEEGGPSWVETLHGTMRSLDHTEGDTCTVVCVLGPERGTHGAESRQGMGFTCGRVEKFDSELNR